MTIRKTISVFFIISFFVMLFSMLLVTYNYVSYRKNSAFLEVLHESVSELDEIILLIDEYLVNPNSRVLFQIKRTAESFRASENFIRLKEYQDDFTMISVLRKSRKDFITLFENFFFLIERGETDGELFQEAVSSLFMASYEIKLQMSVFHQQVHSRITFDNLWFLGVSSLLFGILSALLVFIILWIRRRILSRILRMETLAGYIAHGDFSRTLPHVRNDEIGGLSRSFAAMQNAIRDQMESLAGERDNLRTILSSIGDGVIAADSTGAIHIMNPVAERMTGWKFSEAAGHSIHEVIRIENAITHEPVPNPLQRVLDTGEPVKCPENAVLVNRNGSESQIQDSGAPVRSQDGTLQGAVLVFRDVTEEMHMREAVTRNEKMLSVGGLAAGIAHEIAGPLADLEQTLDKVLERFDPENDENRATAEAVHTPMESVTAYLQESGVSMKMDIIRDDTAWISRTLEKMLMFADSKNNKREKTSIVTLLDTAVELAKTDYDIKELYDLRKVIIVRDYEKNLPDIVCSPVAMQLVFLNIIRNGVRAMYTAGTDPFRFLFRIYRDEEARMICIEISDNGPGMDESVKRRAFEPFFTTQDAGKGRGLGLSIAYFIVTTTHAGTIDVISSPGQGSLFIIKLPYEGTE